MNSWYWGGVSYNNTGFLSCQGKQSILPWRVIIIIIDIISGIGRFFHGRLNQTREDIYGFVCGGRTKFFPPQIGRIKWCGGLWLRGQLFSWHAMVALLWWNMLHAKIPQFEGINNLSWRVWSNFSEGANVGRSNLISTVWVL